MLSRIMKAARGLWYAIALVALSQAPLWAQASACPGSAWGGQTGQPYRLQSQSLVTETRTVQLSAGTGTCGVGGSTTATVSEQYNVGYYENQVSHQVVRVDCRTGSVI